MTSACGMELSVHDQLLMGVDCDGFSHGGLDIVPKVSLSRLTLERRQSINECYNSNMFSSIGNSRRSSVDSGDMEVPSLISARPSIAISIEQSSLNNNNNEKEKEDEIEMSNGNNETLDQSSISITTVLACIILPHIWMLL